jgi:hypothetical protein
LADNGQDDEGYNNRGSKKKKKKKKEKNDAPADYGSWKFAQDAPQ